ncbi:MAG TPA: hypothetical protein PLH98_02450 [Ruminococcus flavefaciens]|nr:hypothetical protein [Ruminococcus flavefaciens]HQL99409.1 hypothetical protein [Ruminococcus flavefaciens]
MEQFRKKLRRRVLLSVIFCLSGLFIYVALIRITGAPEYTKGILFGVLSGSLTVSVFNIFRLMPLLQDEEKLKKAYIAETDERNTLIQKESARTVLSISIMTAALAAIAASFFNPVITLTLSANIILIGIVSIAVTAYYNKKL